MRKMRSECSDGSSISTISRHQNQFVEDIGQSVANALFGYNNTNETQTSNNEEESGTLRPKRIAKKVQQVSEFINMKFSFQFCSVLEFFSSSSLLSNLL